MAAIIVAALLVSGVAVAGFLTLLALGIHGYDASRRLADPPRTHVEAITRRLLGLTATNGTSEHNDQKRRHINA